MRSLLFLTLLAAPAAQASGPLLALSSDSATYAVGATAHLSAVALVAPQSPNEDIYLGATLNNAPVPVQQTTNGVGLTLAGPLSGGSYTWTVQIYLEDSVFAAQLNNFSTALTLQNGQLTTQLGATTDPTQRAALQAQLAQNNSLIQEAALELAQIRHPFGAPQSLSFQAQ